MRCLRCLLPGRETHHEIGVRIALGACRADVPQLVSTQGARLAALGIAIGLLPSLALTKFMARLAYGVSTTDPLTFVAVALLPGFVAMAACYVFTRRAMAVDPNARPAWRAAATVNGGGCGPIEEPPIRYA